MTHQTKESFSILFQKCKNKNEYEKCNSLIDEINKIGTNYDVKAIGLTTDFIPCENKDFKITYQLAAHNYVFKPFKEFCENPKKETFAELYKNYENYEQQQIKNKVETELTKIDKKYDNVAKNKSNKKKINEVCKMNLKRIINGIDKDYTIEKEDKGKIIYKADNITLTNNFGIWTFDYVKEAFDECRDISIIPEADCENENCDKDQNAGTRKTRRRTNSKHKKSRNNRRKSNRRKSNRRRRYGR